MQSSEKLKRSKVVMYKYKILFVTKNNVIKYEI